MRKRAIEEEAPSRPEPAICGACSTVPLSVLALDLPAPVAGWPKMLAARGIELVDDDLGRPAIARDDARRLFEDNREREALRRGRERRPPSKEEEPAAAETAWGSRAGGHLARRAGAGRDDEGGPTMNNRTTYVWGVAADSAGLIHQNGVESEEISGGGLRVWERHQYDHEPASAYANVHPAPMPMKWCHGEDIGRVVALRRAHGRLLAVAECDLEPDDLELLTRERGDLRWSTGTNNRRSEALRITEISLTPSPATVGLWAVRWYKMGVTKGNLPMWVKEDLQRAYKIEHRSRGELRVHEVGRAPAANAGDEYERLGRELRMSGAPINYSAPVGRVLAVGGRPVRRGRTP